MKKNYRTETEAEHRERMRELQEEMRAKMRAAKDRRGLLICHTGDGKGKTSAAFGMVARQLAHGNTVAVVQFIKASNDHVERLLRGPLLTWDHYGEGFTWDTQDKAADIACCRAGWARAREHMANPEVDFVLLDEINVVLQLGYLPVEEVVDALRKKRVDQHVVATGRGAPAELIEAADLVTEMKVIKHPFDVGVPAQAGIEY
ncbi:MAG: cob(I)yrinic acid a,c-diamide adenosyltransferase [Opitutaceae bacterium]|jgi:cob(I)alamin adenosyltransferase|nr:cob(I)yrinic acid a,c-diamide adenosyltransferase [Opitutaceae bacterium]